MARPFQSFATRSGWSLMMKVGAKRFKELTALPVSVAVLDKSGRITAVNDRWRDFGRRNGLRLPNAGVGLDYLHYCSSSEAHSSRFKKDLRALLGGQLDLLTLIYPCHSSSEKRWFCLIGLPLSRDKPAGVALLHVNLSAMIPIGAHPSRAEMERGEKARRTSDVIAMSGAIEHAAVETLSSQLNALLKSALGGAEHRKNSVRSESSSIDSRTQLTKRQMEILHLLGEGKTNKEIANALFRSPYTIKQHVAAILRRLRLKSRTQAAVIASLLHNKGTAEPLARGFMSWSKARSATTRSRSSRRGPP